MNGTLTGYLNLLISPITSELTLILMLKYHFIDFYLSFQDVQLRKLGHHTTEFSWLGSPWTCRKRRRHYPSFIRNGVQIYVSAYMNSSLTCRGEKNPIGTVANLLAGFAAAFFF